MKPIIASPLTKRWRRGPRCFEPDEFLEFLSGSLASAYINAGTRHRSRPAPAAIRLQYIGSLQIGDELADAAR